MRPGRNLAICSFVALFLSGCAFGIPDADGWQPVKPEPCEIVVINKTTGHAVCMSRERFLREQAPILFPPDF